IRPMPALRFFKIGVDLDVKGDRDPAAKLVKAKPVRKAPPPEALTDRDLDAIRALQRDLAAEPEPFRELAAQAGYETAELLAHRNAGFVQNGMGVWRVPGERLDECGQTMAAFRSVSHCYQRPTYPDWP